LCFTWRAGVSSFVSEFVKRKLAEKNRKPGGKKKKGAAAAAVAAAPQPSGVSAAAVGLVHAGRLGVCICCCGRTCCCCVRAAGVGLVHAGRLTTTRQSV
jgi:hypothetical protein